MSVDYFNEERKAYLSLRKSASCAHKLDYHFVFVAKYRRAVLTGEVAEALRDLVVQTCRERRWLLLGLSIQPEHMHVLIGLPPTAAPAEIAHDLKGLTSFKMLGRFPELGERLGSSQLWGRGYSVETLGRSNVAQIDSYIQSQQAHHTEGKVDCK